MGPMSRGRLLVTSTLVLIACGLPAAPASAAIDPGGYTIRAREISVPGSGPGLDGGSVDCGRGKRVVTGGAFWRRETGGADPSLNAYLSSSAPKPNARGWFASGINWSSETLILRIVAYCLPAVQVGTYTVRTVDRTVDAKHFRSGTPRCGKGKRVVTGGAFWRASDGSPETAVEGYLRSSTPDPDGKGWYGVGYSDVATMQLRVVALCRPSGSVGPYTRRTRDIPIATDTVGSGARSCGAGKLTVPGGAFWHREAEGRDGSMAAWLRASAPVQGATAWYAGGLSDAREELLLRLVTFCLPD
jgi:hypothetical protein